MTEKIDSTDNYSTNELKEGRGMRDEGRGMREEGRGKRDEG